MWFFTTPCAQVQRNCALCTPPTVRTASVGSVWWWSSHTVESIERAQLWPARDRNVTVATFTREWITSTLAASERKETTKGLYANLAGSHIIPSKLGALPLAKLRASHVEAWVVELRAKERASINPTGVRTLADSTIRSTYTVLRSILDTAVRDGALARNPAAAVKRPKVARTEAAHLSSDQLRATCGP